MTEVLEATSFLELPEDGNPYPLDTTLRDRLLAILYVDPEDGLSGLDPLARCWRSRGVGFHEGSIPAVAVQQTVDYRNTLACVRILWMWLIDPLLGDEHLFQHCDTYGCCNPTHRLPGVRRTDLSDTCANGHPVSNLVYRNRRRLCRVCEVESKRRWRAKRRAAGLPSI